MDQALHEAVAFLATRNAAPPRAAIILGSGLGNLANRLEAPVAVPYDEIPHFPRATAIGHSGRLVFGSLDGVAVAAMQGRFHLYEGYRVEQVAFPVRVLAALGATALIVTNASGGLNPQYRSGDILVLDSHIDLMFRPGRAVEDLARRRATPSFPYDAVLAERSMEVARRENIPAHQGVYVGLLGPNYETRAEYRFLRKFADAVGMSTIPEVRVATELRLRILALSVITNVARPDAPAHVTGQQVIDVAAQAGPRLEAIVTGVVRAIHTDV